MHVVGAVEDEMNLAEFGPLRHVQGIKQPPADLQMPYIFKHAHARRFVQDDDSLNLFQETQEEIKHFLGALLNAPC